MTKRPTLGAALLLLSLSVAKLLFAQGAALSGSQSKAPITGEDRDRLLARERSYSSSAVPSAMTSAEISL